MAQAGLDDVLTSIRSVSAIKDAAVIVHGGAGCAAATESLSEGARIISTNLDERASIMGGEEALAEAVAKVRAEGPAKIIFIVGTPMTAINNDDVASVIREGDLPESRLVHLFASGFSSKTFASGHDAAAHAILRSLVAPADPAAPRSPDLLLAAMSEGPADLFEIAASLCSLGLKAAPLPRLSSAAAIEKAGRAKAVLALRPSEGGYLAQALSESFGVSLIETEPPIGLKATRSFLAAAAGFFRNQDGAASESGIELEAAEAAARKPAQGKRFLISADLGALASFSEAIEELGGSVAALAAPLAEKSDLKRIERLIKSTGPDTLISIGFEQSFELATILSQSPFDFVIGGPGLSALSRSFGAIHLCSWRTMFYGFGGLLRLSKILSAEAASLRRPSKREGSSYRQSWLSKSGSWHVKLESA
jgi:nitrogenase molybdenum-iron protein alpha chain